MKALLFCCLVLLLVVLTWVSWVLCLGFIVFTWATQGLFSPNVTHRSSWKNKVSIPKHLQVKLTSPQHTHGLLCMSPSQTQESEE